MRIFNQNHKLTIAILAIHSKLATTANHLEHYSFNGTFTPISDIHLQQTAIIFIHILQTLSSFCWSGWMYDCGTIRHVAMVSDLVSACCDVIQHGFRCQCPCVQRRRHLRDRMSSRVTHKSTCRCNYRDHC